MSATPPTKPLRVAGLYRVSTDGQAARGGSQQAQRDAIESWASSAGHVVVEWYGEHDRSGQSLDTSPDFRRMLDDAERDRWDVVACTSVDRFRREQTDALVARRHLTKNGKRLHVLDFGRDVTEDDLSNDIVFSISAMVAQAEGRRFVARGRAARDTARKRNRAMGPPPFGYRYTRLHEGPQIEKDPEQSAAVEFVWQELRRGVATHEISRRTELRGYLSAEGQLGVPQPTITNMARRAVYAGHGRTYVDGKKQDGVLGPLLDWEPYIDAEGWLTVQNAMTLRRNSTTARGGRPARLFLLGNAHGTCWECGKPLYVRKDAYSDHYFCRSRKDGTPCSMPRIPRLMLDGAVRNFIETMDLLIIEEEVASGEAELRRAREDLSRRIPFAEREVRKIQARIDQDAIAVLDELEREHAISRLRQRDTAQRNVMTLTDARNDIDAKLAGITTVVTTIEDFHDEMRRSFVGGHGFDIEAFRGNLRHVFSNIRVRVLPSKLAAINTGTRFPVLRRTGVTPGKPDFVTMIPLAHPEGTELDDGRSTLCLWFDLNPAFLDRLEYGQGLLPLRSAQ